MNKPLRCWLTRQKKIQIFLFFMAASAFAFSLNTFAGDSRHLVINAAGIEISVFTYRPICNKPSIIFVFHGLNRKAKNARDNAIELADNACLMVFAPLFDKDRFPNWRYHRAGISRDGVIQPPNQWTAPVLLSLVGQSRVHAKNPGAKVYLFGHSAGGQFLSRIAAYTRLPDIERIVIANPSVYVSTELDEEAPYGFAGVFIDEMARKQLETYLKSPITIFVGKKDIGKKYLLNNHQSAQQGKNRYERGRNIYFRAKHKARQLGADFSWKLVEAHEIGHSSSDMLKSIEIYQALGLTQSNASM